MEHVGTLAETNDVLSPTIILLFGLLSPPAEQEEECHFCFETIAKGQFMVLKLPCCGHLTHTSYFETWASTSQKESIVHCAYCRTAYPYEDTCFLCLQEYTEKTQLHKVLPHKSSRGMHCRSHSSTLTPNLRPHARMWTTYRL